MQSHTPTGRYSPSQTASTRSRHYQLGHWLRSARLSRGVRRGEQPLHQWLHHQRGHQVGHPNVGARKGRGTSPGPPSCPYAPKVVE
jgi:hypothetical protein